ncbi:hypothetical protein ANCDUO_07329 [Ancylostoma duodenale]|uniref:Uncharacterized protein n=1 Tax=Ancylostoma duodenale TaxID=51022 RepID=A0A0C2GZ56_9BILA|nr:hypothetical protein ANCDUO_07329 [Ancylostoma duodenale]
MKSRLVFWFGQIQMIEWCQPGPRAIVGARSHRAVGHMMATLETS